MLAIAVGSGRVGYVFLVDGAPFNWKLSRKASRSPEHAATHAGEWIDRLRPDLVVTEKITTRCRKGVRAKALMEAVARTASEQDLFDVAVERPRQFPNKYAEAAALADRFPDLRPWVPKPRKLWESEPRSITYFEALSLALVVIDPAASLEERGLA